MKKMLERIQSGEYARAWMAEHAAGRLEEARRRLEESGRLTVGGVAPIPLSRTQPPGTPTQLELDAMAAEVEQTYRKMGFIS